MTSTTFIHSFERPALLSRLFATSDSWGATALRVALALVFFPHGAQKLFGWFGGYGFNGTMGYFTGALGIPYVFGVAAILAESLGAAALLLGFGTRIAAFALAVNMAVAALLVHARFGFFMNWFGNQQGEGIEYHILAISALAVVMAIGGGRLSVDRSIARG